MQTINRVRTIEQKMIKPWWMLPALWGLDVALAALCWGVMIAALFGISLLTFGPLLLLFGMVWSYTLTTRVLRALMGRDVYFADYYRGHAFLMLIVALCVLLATLWLLFFNVGQYLISFFIIPLVVILAAHIPVLKKVPFYRELALSAGFVFSCAVPAYFYSFIYSPLHMVFNSHLWCLICLFFLFNVERYKPLNGEAGEKALVWVQAGVLLLFLPCVYKVLAPGEDLYEHHFYGAICIAAAGLHFISSCRKKISPPVWYAFCWLSMGVPALLGVLLYAPETWFN